MQPALSSFKQEIDAMFQKTFQELSQKNNLNKAILNNLMDAASEQSNRIGHLDDNLQNLKNTATPHLSSIKSQVASQQKNIHQNFDNMMFRLNQVEENITSMRKKAQKNLEINKQSDQSMNQLLKQLEKIEREEGAIDYHGDKDQLARQVDQFQRVLDQQLQGLKNIDKNLEIGKKITIQPMKTFEAKIAIHNRNNQQTLKQKLRGFTEKLRGLEKRIDESTWAMSNETNKAKLQQKKIVDEMSIIQKQMFTLKVQLQGADNKRKQQIQSSAATLDNMVQQMLAETKKLQYRVDTLRKGFEKQAHKNGLK